MNFFDLGRKIGFLLVMSFIVWYNPQCFLCYHTVLYEDINYGLSISTQIP